MKRFFAGLCQPWFALVLSGLLGGPCVAAEPGVPPAHDAPGDRERDGRHDFDFELGRWKAHVLTLLHRLAHANDWEEFTGTVVTRGLPMLEGWNESEMHVDSIKSGRRIDLLAVRTYNPSTHQWAIYGTSLKSGVFDPPLIGQFTDGRGELYSQDTWEGRPVFVRFVWTRVDVNHTHLEQSFSDDGGKTWETNWIYDGERIP
jgi:hypothetical protein